MTWDATGDTVTGTRYGKQRLGFEELPRFCSDVFRGGNVHVYVSRGLPQSPSTIPFLIQGLSLTLELTVLARLAGQQAIGILLSPPSQL